jgi:tripartite-type tricarboxylate transporter receptor subunit TctC
MSLTLWNTLRSAGAPLRQLSKVVATAVLLAMGSGAGAQSFPVKPIRLVVPAPPGGNIDIIGRIVQARLGEVLGQPVVVDYRPGAGGVIGGEVVARSAPDGYTTGVFAASLVINPSMIKVLPYDSEKDFTPLGLIADVPSGLVVHPSLPVKNVSQLVALAKARPGEIFYSSPGVGTSGHLGAELFNARAGIKLVHVPYKGVGPAVTDLVGGHVQVMFSSLPAVRSYIGEAGRLRILGQAGATRSPSLPDVPTMQEAGIRDFVVSSGFSFVGPAGLPDTLVERLNSALVKAVKNPASRKDFEIQGADPVGSTTGEHAAYVRREIGKWRKVANDAGILPE